MRKNGSRFISIKQYRATDLFFFAVILFIAEASAFIAVKFFPNAALFTVSFMVPIVITVMVRWGWQCVFYAVGSAILFCAFNNGNIINYIVYGVGNCFIVLMLLPLKFIGSDKITSKWWASTLFVIGGWLCVYLGKSIAWAVCFAIHPIEGSGAAVGFSAYAAYDLPSLALGVLVVLVLRRFEGMFVNQKSYLHCLDEERKEKAKRETYGDNLEDVDGEFLSILYRDDGLY